MFKRLLQARFAFLCAAYENPASAHVKWFLSKSESELLRLPKPALFTQLRADNLLAVTFTMIAFAIAYHLNKRWASCRLNARLNELAARCDTYVQLIMGLFCGVMLLCSAWNMCFFVPNLHLHPCCKWVAVTEALIGVCIAVGLFTRPAAAAMLFILAFSFAKFPLNDCIDLLPMWGISLYLLVGGRGRFSVEHDLGIAGGDSLVACELATLFLRISLGLGLLALGFDEKLLNPQLALNLLQNHPLLNVLHGFGVGNDMFVLLSGLTEAALGVAIALGVFPRLCVLALVGLFTATTIIFGGAEFIGHLPYYAIFAAILLRGANCTAAAKDCRLRVSAASGRLATVVLD